MNDFPLIDLALLFLVAVTGTAAIVLRNLFAAIIMTAIYSLLMALVWVNLDAGDVAFTEAAVGAGVSTILFIGALVLVGPAERKTRGPAFQTRTLRKILAPTEKKRRRFHGPALAAVVLTALALGYGTLDMPRFGDRNAPAHAHPVARAYIAQNAPKVDGPSSSEDYFHGHVPNFVTSVIVAYRAYDTLFELVVIFTAGVSTLILLRRRRRDGGGDFA